MTHKQSMMLHNRHKKMLAAVYVTSKVDDKICNALIVVSPSKLFIKTHNVVWDYSNKDLSVVYTNIFIEEDDI
jgi:hypothetical protein